MSKNTLSEYYVDFSKSEELNDEQKVALQIIQERYLPIERVSYLTDYLGMGLISEEDYSKMTGIPMWV